MLSNDECPERTRLPYWHHKTQPKERWQSFLEGLQERWFEAIVRRDYQNSSDVVIKIFDDRIVFTNPGRLMGNLTVADLQRDDYVSVLRNRLLAEAFYLTGDIEKYGTGFVRIREWLRGYPEVTYFLEEMGDFFKVDIVRPASAEPAGRLRPRTGQIQDLPENLPEHLPENLPEKLSDLQADIIGKMSSDPKVTYMQLAQMTGRSKEAIRHNINKLKDMGIVARVGPAKGGHWRVRLP